MARTPPPPDRQVAPLHPAGEGPHQRDCTEAPSRALEWDGTFSTSRLLSPPSKLRRWLEPPRAGLERELRAAGHAVGAYTSLAVYTESACTQFPRRGSEKWAGRQRDGPPLTGVGSWVKLQIRACSNTAGNAEAQVPCSAPGRPVGPLTWREQRGWAARGLLSSGSPSSSLAPFLSGETS